MTLLNKNLLSANGYKLVTVLGIETSCDETAAAVVTSSRGILSNIVWSQVADHQPYGGVVPEIAARAHIEQILPVVERALIEAGVAPHQLDAIAVTAGPGLIGGVIIGAMTAKALASVWQKPLIAVNHLEGHALTVRLTDGVDFPYLLLLVSGGHCQFLEVSGVGQYRKLGGTMDDALGECFDKVAKMLGMPYPGGPQVEMLAQQGDARRFALPVPLKGREGCDFSFSGLKTAVRMMIAELRGKGELDEQAKADICAAFQHAAAESLEDRAKHALAITKTAKTLVVAGGVAANQYLRARLEKLAQAHGLALIAPPIGLCTDNAAMIAWAGLERFQLGLMEPLAEALKFEPRARWPLDQ